MKMCRMITSSLAVQMASNHSLTMSSLFCHPTKAKFSIYEGKNLAEMSETSATKNLMMHYHFHQITVITASWVDIYGQCQWKTS